MTTPVELGARAAAQRLATPRTPALATDVEAALHTPGTTTRPTQYLDPVSLGALIVSIASLAWTIYSDHRKQTSEPRPDVVTRHVRVRLDQSDAPQPPLSPAERDRIIAITVEETLNAARLADPDRNH